MAFRNLPLELHEHIATYLGEDKDICSYTLVSSETYNAVHSSRGAVWRSFFARKYDLPPGKTGRDLMLHYMRRRMILSKVSRSGLRGGVSHSEVRGLEILRDLVVESFARATTTSTPYKTSKNLVQLRRFVQSSNILDNILYDPTTGSYGARLMQTLQLVFTHWQLDTSIRSEIRGFALSQHIVYTRPDEMFLFIDKKWTLNLSYLLHVANFFRYHMKSDHEDTLNHLMLDLENSEKPAAWDQQLNTAPQVTPLGASWMGSFAYIPNPNELDDIRSPSSAENRHNRHVPDVLDVEEGFQTLHIDAPSLTEHISWPAAFEDRLHALPPRSLVELLKLDKQEAYDAYRPPRRSKRGFQGTADDMHILELESRQEQALKRRSVCTQLEKEYARKLSEKPSRLKPGQDYRIFGGCGEDYGPFQCTGVLHNLPSQSGIPGWQRICMMKYSDASPASSSASSTAASSPTSATFSTSPSPISSASSIPAGGFDNPMTSPTNPDGHSHPDDHVSFGDMSALDDQCWCYEGIVLPGGKIILGRWWHPFGEETGYRDMGPFIFWNTGGAENNGSV